MEGAREIIEEVPVEEIQQAIDNNIWLIVLLEQGAELNKRGVAPRVARGGQQAPPAPEYLPEPDETYQ